MPLSTHELCNVLGEEVNDIKPLLAKLRSEGKIVTNSQGQYTTRNSVTDLKSIIENMEAAN